MWQPLTVALIIALAFFFLARRFIRSLRRQSPACECCAQGCDLNKIEEPDVLCLMPACRLK